MRCEAWLPQIAPVRTGARAGSRIGRLGSAARGGPQHLEPARCARSTVPFEKPGSRRTRLTKEISVAQERGGLPRDRPRERQGRVADPQDQVLRNTRQPRLFHEDRPRWGPVPPESPADSIARNDGKFALSRPAALTLRGSSSCPPFPKIILPNGRRAGPHGAPVRGEPKNTIRGR